MFDKLKTKIKSSNVASQASQQSFQPPPGPPPNAQYQTLTRYHDARQQIFAPPAGPPPSIEETQLAALKRFVRDQDLRRTVGWIVLLRIPWYWLMSWVLSIQLCLLVLLCNFNTLVQGVWKCTGIRQGMLSLALLSIVFSLYPFLEISEMSL